MNNQALERMTAPRLDNLIAQAENGYEIADDCTKGLMDELFHKLQVIAVSGDDERRELWLSVPRGSIDEFGDYEEYLAEGEVENREEFQELWLSEYPEPQKWYSLVALVYKDIYTVFLGGKLVLQKKPEMPEHFPYDKTELATWLLTAVKDAIKSIKAGEYNVTVSNNLPFRQRLGKIPREDYWQIFPEYKEDYLREITADEIIRIAGLIQDQPLHSSATRLPEMSAGVFFACCRLGYEANCYQEIAGLTPREMYRAHADGRDEGLLSLDESSSEAFSSWYHDKSRFGGHPWEVCRGGNSTHISLYVCQDDKGWWLALAGSSQGRSVETVKFYLALADRGLPIFLRDGREIAAMLAGTDAIGIVPEGIFPRYCDMLFKGERMLTYMNLPWERSEQVVQAAFWYPLRETCLI